MPLLKFGIIGCGLIGQKRAAAISKMGEGAKLVIAADFDSSRAASLCERFGGTPSKDAGEVIAGSDIVIVATTHDYLAEIGLQAVSAGKHALIEKPGARNASELAPVAEMAEKRGVQVKIGFNHRFHPAIQKARRLVDDGQIGPLMFVRGRYGHGGRIGYEKEWRFNPEISGGGELLDQGSHLIDLAGWFLGKFSDVYGVLPRFFWSGEVEDNCFMLLKTSDGKCAHLHASWTEWKNMFSLEIYGRNGKIAIDGLGGSYGVEQAAFYKMLPGMGPPESTIWQYPFPDTSWEVELREFLDAINAGRRPVGDIQDALKNLSVIEELYGKEKCQKITVNC
ncbi:MAG: Gfo/Idh/MocA family oxidoreductase [Holosporales bacterium]|jgi:predicted dehydrogenase|nr:Gfo/Idh/MocA family oxidoreductase [Holosporales bacterium]